MSVATRRAVSRSREIGEGQGYLAQPKGDAPRRRPRGPRDERAPQYEPRPRYDQATVLHEMDADEAERLRRALAAPAPVSKIEFADERPSPARPAARRCITTPFASADNRCIRDAMPGHDHCLTCWADLHGETR